MKYLFLIIVSLACTVHVDIHAGNKRTEKAKRQRERKKIEKEQSMQLTNLGDQNDDGDDTGEPSGNAFAQTPPLVTAALTSGGHSSLQSPRDTPASGVASIAVMQAHSVDADNSVPPSPVPELSPTALAKYIAANAGIQCPEGTDSSCASLDIKRAVDGDNDDDAEQENKKGKLLPRSTSAPHLTPSSQSRPGTPTKRGPRLTAANIVAVQTATVNDGNNDDMKSIDLGTKDKKRGCMKCTLL